MTLPILIILLLIVIGDDERIRKFKQHLKQIFCLIIICNEIIKAYEIMTDIKSANTLNIEDWTDRIFVNEGGKEYCLSTKTILIGNDLTEKFCSQIISHIGEHLRIMIIYSTAYINELQKLKAYFCSHGFFFDEFVLQTDQKIYIQTAEKAVSSLKDDTRLIMSLGDDEACEVGKFVASASNLPLAVYALSPDCEKYLAPFSQAFLHGIRDIFITCPPKIVCIDINSPNFYDEHYLASATGIIASKYIALFDWYIAHIFNGEKIDFELFDLALVILNDFLKSTGGLIRREKAANIQLVQTIMKISAIIQLNGQPRLIGGGENTALNVLEAFFQKENKKLLLRGENLFLCAKVLFKAYGLWLNKLKINDFLCPPDNTVRLEKMTECLGINELSALNKISMPRDAQTLEIMLYKWDEYRDELKELYNRFLEKFEQLQKVFKRLYSDAAFWMTKYLTDSDIMLMIGLAPDTSEMFTTLTFIKQTGHLDKYLDEV